MKLPKKCTYSCQERECTWFHPPVRLITIALQAQRRVSHRKPWHDGTFRMDLVLCPETRSIAELNIVCEREHESQNQIIYLTG